MGVTPSFWARSSLITSRAEAPSLIEEALPAVTVPVLLERRAQAGHAFHRGVRSNVLVLFERNRIAAALSHGDGEALGIKATRLFRFGGSAVTLHRELILFFPGDLVLLGHPLAGDAHVEVVVLVPQPVVHHRVDELGVAQAHALASLGHQVGRVGHALHCRRPKRNPRRQRGWLARPT